MAVDFGFGVVVVEVVKGNVGRCGNGIEEDFDVG